MDVKHFKFHEEVVIGLIRATYDAKSKKPNIQLKLRRKSRGKLNLDKRMLVVQKRPTKWKMLKFARYFLYVTIKYELQPQLVH